VKNLKGCMGRAAQGGNRYVVHCVLSKPGLDDKASPPRDNRIGIGKEFSRRLTGYILGSLVVGSVFTVIDSRGLYPT